MAGRSLSMQKCWALPSSCLLNGIALQIKSKDKEVMLKPPHLIVYRSVPLSTRRSSLFGVVMLWATDFFPLWKKVSGVQILLARRLFRGKTCIGPSNFSLSSLQLWRKKTSMVYSWGKHMQGRVHERWCPLLTLHRLFQAYILKWGTINGETCVPWPKG